MIPRLLALWENIRTSLWAVPLAMILIAFGLAIGATRVHVAPGGDPVWYLYSGGVDEAPQFVAHLVTAMITMATLAISITMVVLTLAAQQLGSRLIQTFMRDWHTQVGLGISTGTVIYLLLVLREASGMQNNTPNLAVTLGTALVILSMIVVLMFVHHLARSIIADNVVQSEGRLLDSEIRRLLPEKEAVDATARARAVAGHAQPICAAASGYVRSIDFDRLVALARACDGMVWLDVRAGHYVIRSAEIGRLETGAGAKDDDLKRLAGCVLVGAERTAVQDLEFSMRHLVEIAVRALSPGINDPYTAIAVVDRLGSSLRLVMDRGPAKDVWRDSDGQIRVQAPVWTFEGLVDRAFNQIRQRAGASPDVLIRLVEVLRALILLAGPQQREALARHLTLVVNAARRHIDDESDLRELMRRADLMSQYPRPHQ
jgi:uncharacterized membrane protein